MLRQCSVERLRHGLVSRRDGRIVIAMRHHPRGLKKELRDEYRGDLAPSPELFADFKRHQAASGHDGAFALSRYEERFALSGAALRRLGELSDESRTKDVYLTCQCGMGRRCHREILLLLARALFGARIDQVYHDYPRALERLTSAAREELKAPPPSPRRRQ
jgi:uncharacterized protein YeaO (DUF488 family)